MIRGSQIGRDFRYSETDARNFDIDVILDLLRHGHSDGAVAYVIRGGADPLLCRSVHENFTRAIASIGSQRGPDRLVRTDQIGSTQFEKGGREYIDSTLQVQQQMLSLFDGMTPAQVSAFMLDNVLQEGFLRRGFHFGPARYKSAYANHCTVRAWLDNGQMSLHPHEDVSQIEKVRADQFEIEAIENTISFNVCVSRTGTGGEAVVWDLRPSPEWRRSLGVFDRGYPYPLDALDDVRSISVQLEPGDCYFLNASFLHGVRPTRGERVTAGRFLGVIPGNRIVFWT
ncbi:2OG-Fe(II)-dependent halogenase WelO5 family protein [Nocardia terpenica]|uniref:Fe2OG dioxygenase domain-containing protein n=1 Tax=Nocardia terpenica TaxID=455432 RepID=A0A291RRB4_9NOCA|nr:hypothetical protein [Nocardia terpenica]ATL69772.1 hypothetical protein CRH09_29970 [Nocardia terpenica]